MSQRWLGFISVVLCSGALLLLLATARRDHSRNSSLHRDAIKTGFLTGDAAPDFAIPSLDGHTVRLSGFRGHPVLLNFWATWCAPCRVETPWLVELDRRYRPDGMQVVGVSLDDAGSEQAVTKFTKDFGMKYDVLSGNSSLADIYGGVPFLPQSFFIDRTGIIRKTTVGVITKADLESAAKELLIAGDRMSQLVPADPR